MNIFRIEMKANLKSLLLWSIGVIFMVVAGMGKYASLENSGQSMNALMADMPKSMQAIMGTGSFDISDPLGYFGLLFLYLAMMAAIHASMIGANIVSKEERDKTIEFLLVKPISRTRIISLKLGSALVNVIIFNLITYLSSLMMVQKYAGSDSVASEITLLMAGMLFLQLIFLVIGTSIGAAYKNAKKATSLATAFLLIFFLLSIAVDMNEKLAGLRFFTPFKYFDAKNILNDGAFDPLYLGLSAALIGLLLSVTYQSFQKRDMNV